MTDSRKAGRLLFAGAGLLALCATGCTTSSAAESPIPNGGTPSTSGAVVASAETVDSSTAATVATPATTPTTATTATTLVVPPVAPIDGAALLADGLAALTTSYHFTTSISVDDAVVLLADGDRVADGVRLALTGDAGIVNYIITPAGSWVMPHDGEWEQLDSAAAPSDPITALASPSAVTVTTADATAATLSVTVPAAALGLASGPDVSMTCDLVEGRLQRVRYQSMVDGRPAVVTAEFAAVVDGSPVIAPI